MMKKILKALPCLFIMAIMMGSAFGSVVNYNETYETVEQSTVIDNKPVINETTQELVNVENRTYDDVTVKNETVSNITYEEHSQKQVGEKTVYSHGGKNYKGSEIDKVVLADGTVIKYADNKNLAGCNPNPVNKYVPATLYLKNGEVIDIVIHNEGNKAYQNYGYRNTVPVYEDQTTVVNNITNKVTTFINHITEVIYEIVNKPVPTPVVNNTTDVPTENTTDVNTTENVTENITDVPSENITENVTNTTDVPVVDPTENTTDVNNTTENVTDIPGDEPVVNDTADVPSENITREVVDNTDDTNTTVDTLEMHKTGGAVAGLILVIVLMVLMVVRIKRA